MMSCQFAIFFRCSRRIRPLSSTSPISTPRIRDHLANTSLTSWQRFTPSISRIAWITPASKGCLCRVRTSRSSPSKSPSSGRRSLRRCRTLRVSCYCLPNCQHIFWTCRKERQDFAPLESILKEDCRREEEEEGAHPRVLRDVQRLQEARAPTTATAPDPT